MPTSPVLFSSPMDFNLNHKKKNSSYLNDRIPTRNSVLQMTTSNFSNSPYGSGSFGIHKAVQSMAINVSLVVSVLLSCLVAACYGHVSFSSLQKTLVVTATPQPGQVLKAGEDNITVTWSLNTTFPAGTDSAYKKVKVQLCYAPISQQDRAWRKTVDDLSKDKTCQHKIVEKPYSRFNNFTWTVQKDVPTATHFIRAYVHNSADEEVAFGQTTDSQKTTNLFEVQAISGRHVSLDIASVCLSAFSVLSLFGFFFLEERKAKASQAK